MITDAPINPDDKVYLFLVACGFSAREIAEMRMGSRLFHDLGLYGDSAEECMFVLQKKFQVDLSNFSFEKHIPPEFEGRSRLDAFVRSLTMPIESRLIRDRTKYEPVTLEAINRSMIIGRWLA